MPVSSIPGSQWMPSPTAIRPSGTENSGWSAPGRVQPLKATPNERVRSFASWREPRDLREVGPPASAAAAAMRKTAVVTVMPLRACALQREEH